MNSGVIIKWKKLTAWQSQLIKQLLIFIVQDLAISQKELWAKVKPNTGKDK